MNLLDPPVWIFFHRISFTIQGSTNIFSRDGQSLPIKVSRMNILGFLGHVVSVITIQLWYCTANTAMYNKNKWIWLGFNTTSFSEMHTIPDGDHG